MKNLKIIEKNEKCLVPSCMKNQNRRGLCTNHYSYASQFIRQGKTSWKALEEKEKALPLNKWNSGVKKWFLE